MTPNSHDLPARTWQKTAFAIKIHAKAFRFDSVGYITALKWRILGKRVRARAHFARLLGQTSLAYQWWLMHARGTRLPSPPGKPDIIALVAGEETSEAMQETLGSLAKEGVPWRIVGSDAADDLAKAAAAIDWTAGSWLLAMREGDRLAVGAADDYRTAIRDHGEVCAIFADDDVHGLRGKRMAPHFKSGWNAELYSHHDYITGACIVRVESDALAVAAAQPDWAAALTAAGITAGGRAAHIAQVLHHRKSRPIPPAQTKPLTVAANLPRVSAIIPTRNRADLLRTCIAGLLATDYPALEIIIADNDSNEPETQAYLAELVRQGVVVLPQPGPFNYSTINNNAVAIATGELLCLMNNDIEILEPDWLAIMATQALRPDVGAVGAQLLYPDGRIQHAGVVIGVGNAAGHAHRFLRPEAEGYFRRHALPQFVSAVTAACLVVRKDRFDAVGGLDEANFAVAFNDVDLCLRLNRHGWQSFYEPRAVLVHHESISRGHDTDPVGAARFAGELAALQRIWHTDAITDPFHHPNLSRASEQFAINVVP
jgi:GT2 family glycosyltransferase